MLCVETSAYDSLLETARTRHSCRAYQSRQVPAEVIRRILDMAETAPSDCNTQPWNVFLLQGAPLEALRKDMYETAARHAPPTSDVPPISRYTGAYQDRRRACGWSLYGAVGVTKGDREASGRQALENFRFFGAPHLAIVTSPRDLGERGMFDTGIYLGYFVMAAQALGVASVPQGAIAHQAEVIRRHVPISDELQIICGISFGYSDTGHVANSFRMDRVPRADYLTELK